MSCFGQLPDDSQSNGAATAGNDDVTSGERVLSEAHIKPPINGLCSSFTKRQGKIPSALISSKAFPRRSIGKEILERERLDS